MSNNNLLFVKAWIEKADHDLGSAKVIFQHIPECFDTIAFRCQQAVEKYIKAALIFSNIEIQKSHDLIYLLDKLSDYSEIDDETYVKAIPLNGFAIEIRYPNKVIMLSEVEIRKAISIADDFRSLMLRIIKIEEK